MDKWDYLLYEPEPMSEEAWQELVRRCQKDIRVYQIYIASNVERNWMTEKFDVKEVYDQK